jgi:hypothetical protein
MEVHTHTHTARKKWTHYLWEFLMLFLAVFAGFLAENQREHIVEHQLKDSSPIALNELANRLKYWAAGSQRLLQLLEQLKKMAFELIGLIKKEYHLD